MIERSTRSPQPTLPHGLELDREKKYGETTLWWATAVTATHRSPTTTSVARPRRQPISPRAVPAAVGIPADRRRAAMPSTLTVPEPLGHPADDAERRGHAGTGREGRQQAVVLAAAERALEVVAERRACRSRCRPRSPGRCARRRATSPSETSSMAVAPADRRRPARRRSAGSGRAGRRWPPDAALGSSPRASASGPPLASTPVAEQQAEPLGGERRGLRRGPRRRRPEHPSAAPVPVPAGRRTP